MTKRKNFSHLIMYPRNEFNLKLKECPTNFAR